MMATFTLTSMNSWKGRSVQFTGFFPDWRLGFLTLACGLTLLLAWWWFQLIHGDLTPLVLLPGVGPLMVLLTIVYLLTLLISSVLIGSALKAPGIATWALLIAFFALGVITLNFIAAALWGSDSLSNWDIIVILGIGSVGVFRFSYSLWQTWSSKKVADREKSALDLLTNALTRQGFHEQFNALPVTRQHGVLALLDVNQLKSINDRHGHNVGDEQIRRLSEALQSNLPSQALIARWGGDEFLVFFIGQTEVTSRQQLLMLQANLPSLALFSPVFSFGLTELIQGHTFERGFALADHQLYLAKSQDRALGRTSEEDRWLVNFSQHLEQLKTTQEVIEEGVVLVRQAFQFDAASYLQMEREQHQLRVGAVDLAPTCAFPKEIGTWLPLLRMGEQAIYERQTVVSVDYPTDPEALPQVVAAGVKSMVVTPVQTNGQVVGLLALCHLSTWKAVPLATQQLLEDAAFRLSHVLDVHQAVATVRSTLEGGLLGLGVALEARDLETRGHTERVVMLASCLGEALNFTLLELDELRQGAYLHDIGKLSIPDRILLKPGALDPEEWKIMKTHVQHGVTIAERIPHLAPGVLNVIKAHHER